jgi:predicted porin
MLGAAVPVGSGEFRFSFVRNAIPGSQASLYAVGYNYFLSKRTQLYTTVGIIRNDGVARFALWPSSQDLGRPTVGGADEQGMQAGIRHTF